MKINLDPNGMCLTKDKKKLDLKEALKITGVKAAVCFKDGDITPQMIREAESDEQLIKRGINTILSDHTSPSEQVSVSLEITGIPKILCMILNNEHEYAADERSIRYTIIKENAAISKEEVTLYYKWLNIFINILNSKYYDFFKKFNQGKTEEATIKKTNNAIKKIAQENARYLITLFVPTTLTYTVPLAQINKICVYMQRIIDNPLNEFEEALIPYLQEFISKLKDLDVVITNQKIAKLKIINVPDNDDYFYHNNKKIDLSLFAKRNKFSALGKENEVGYNISYNFGLTISALAEMQRHRTAYFECSYPSNTNFKVYTPILIRENKKLSEEWFKDVMSLKQFYPQAQLLDVNICAPLKNIINFIGKERACDRALLEVQDTFTNQLIPQIYEELVRNQKLELAKNLEPYTNRLRCAYPDYNCPTPCGHPRVKRKF